MKYTQPRPPNFSETCTASSVVDQSRGADYKLAPALGASIDALAPGEPGDVLEQTSYSSPVHYSDLPHGSKSEWRLIPLLRAAAAPGTGPALVQPQIGWTSDFTGDFTGAGISEVLLYDASWWLGTFSGSGSGLTWVLADVIQFGTNPLIWTGRFAGAGTPQVLIFNSANWWLGTFSGNHLDWASLLNPSGFVPTGPSWVGDFTGAGRSELLVYSVSDTGWWLGTLSGTGLDFVRVAFNGGFTVGGANSGGWPTDPSWAGDFTGAGQAQLLFYHAHTGDPPQDQYWRLGSFNGNNLTWSDSGATTGGVTYTPGDPTWVGHFTGAGKLGLLFYSPSDQNWWLASFMANLPLSWDQITSTGGPRYPTLARAWVGDFTGAGQSQLLFYEPDDQNWWLGTISGSNLEWALAGNSSGFGDTSQYPTWIGDFTGSGRPEVLFYSPGDRNGWLGSFTGSHLSWALVGGPLDVTNPYAGWDQRTPLETLRTAARLLKQRGGQLQDQHQIRALADLAVTGRFAYETLASMKLNQPDDVVTALNLDAEYTDAARQVVLRAQKVAWAIRGDPSWRAALRPQLGWIGVSGEDDTPHRPCNVSSLLAPQFDIQVPVGGRTYTTRFAILEESPPSLFPQRDAVPPTFLPPDQAPLVAPDSDYVIVFMPGDTSRIEEAGDLIPALFQVAAERGIKITVISFDLIGWGYSGRRVIDRDGNSLPFDQTLFPTVTYPANPPALQFVEDFVVALLQTLHRGPPYIDLTRVVPVGGSLGGNLALRLGRRTDLPWLNAVCGWSPGSVWPSKAKNPDRGGATADATALGAVVGFIAGVLFGGLIGGVIGAVAGAAYGASQAWPLDQESIKQCATNMNQPEGDAQREQYFVDTFDKDTFNVVGFQIVPPQATMWYRGDWTPCKVNSMVQDRLDRRETYDQTFRRWHWRISQDQLVYSHRDPDPATGVPRYLLNKVPMLLAAGADDNYHWANIQYVAIYDFTRDLASKMTVAGTSLFLLTTGHSIHNERPVELAHAIFDFLSTVTFPPPSIDLSYLFPLLLDDQG